MKIKFVNGHAVKSDIQEENIRYFENGDIVVEYKGRQIKISPSKGEMTVIETVKGIHGLVCHQHIQNTPVSGTLYLGRRPEFLGEKFVEWCEQRNIDSVRHRRPNREYPMIGDIKTDGIVYESVNTEGEKCRIVENAKYVIHKTTYETILYTRQSVYELGI